MIKKLEQKFWKMCEQKSSLDTYVHYDWPFAKHFDSFRNTLQKSIWQCTARILRNLQCEFITHNQQPNLIFYLLEKRERNLTLEI